MARAQRRPEEDSDQCSDDISSQQSGLETLKERLRTATTNLRDLRADMLTKIGKLEDQVDRLAEQIAAFKGALSLAHWAVPFLAGSIVSLTVWGLYNAFAGRPGP